MLKMLIQILYMLPNDADKNENHQHKTALNASN